MRYKLDMLKGDKCAQYRIGEESEAMLDEGIGHHVEQVGRVGRVCQLRIGLLQRNSIFANVAALCMGKFGRGVLPIVCEKVTGTVRGGLSWAVEL